MKINLKIILPIFVLLLITLVAFGYLLYFFDMEASKIAYESSKFRELNTLSQRLGKEQEITEYNMIVYIFNQDPKALSAISESELNKAKTIDQIYPYIDNDNNLKLINNYIEARKDIYKTRNDLLQAVTNHDQAGINQKYYLWNTQTQKIRNTITQIEENNLTSLGNIFTSFKQIEERVGQVILGLFFIVVIAIFIFFYYLKHYITSPIEKLSRYADEVSEKNFSNIVDRNMIRTDEIGILFRAFTNMAKSLKSTYLTLEQSIKDRTQELTKRTTELEDTQKVTLNILEDLSRERQILLETQALDEAILSSIGDCLVVIDKQGLITFTNEAFEKTTGWKSPEVLGKKFVEIIPSETEKGERIGNHKRFITRIIGGEDPDPDMVSTVYYLRKDGSRFPVDSLVKRILLDGKVIGAVKTFRDITREKDIDKAKTEFVALAAHQLRTPLSAISWYTEMLLSGDAGELGETQKKYLDQIYQGNQRMIDMVKSFLNVSRIDMGSLVMEETSTDISTLLQSVVDEQRRKIIIKNIELVLDCEKGLPNINIDPNRIRMVIQNLLSNAVKYTPDRGKISVLVSSDKKNKLVKMEFRDNGYGIPKTSYDKIFTKLYRAENVIEKATEGTGLGLYIVKNILESSGGKIWFESEEDKGTTFYITLPT